MDGQQISERMQELNSMNSFDRARAKLERKKARLERVEEPKVAPIEKPVTPSQSADAVIQVRVILPDREVSFSLTKASVYGNVLKHKLTEAELKKAIASGLASIMGAVR